MIYFLQLESGAIKIGFTENLEARLAQLESHYQSPVFLLATMPGGRKEEHEIHQQFGHLRFGRLEQFRPAQELFEFINKPIIVDIDPDLVEAQSVKPCKYVSVKLREDLADAARVVCAARKISIGEYLSELTSSAILRDQASAAKRLLDQPNR